MHDSKTVKNLRYAVVSPVLNVENYVEKTIGSMISQSILPQQWVIIDDGSTDNTFSIIKNYEQKYDFITLASKPDNHWNSSQKDPKISSYKDRLAHGAEIRAFNYGLKLVKERDYDFIVKLDGDLSFSNDYFEKIFHEFRTNPRLGIAGGHCYQLKKGQLRMERVPRAHVRGATKVYRRKCFADIGGVMEVFGWDTIDELKAQMNGWETSSFMEPKVVHHRPTTAAAGLLRGKVLQGQGAYFLGYHPLFMLARSIKNMTTRPLVIGGIAMFWGFFASYVNGVKQFEDINVREYLRRTQRARLFGWLRLNNINQGKKVPKKKAF